MLVRFLSAGLWYLKTHLFPPLGLTLSSSPSPSSKVDSLVSALAVFTLVSVSRFVPVSRVFLSMLPLSTTEFSTTALVVLIMVLNELASGDTLGLSRTTKNPQSLTLCGFLYFFVPGRNIIWWSWGDLNPRPKLLHPRYYMLSHSLHSPTRCGETRHALTSSIGFNASAPSRTSTRSCEG